MIRYSKQDQLNPEKETAVELNLIPVMVFAVGYFLARGLIGAASNTVHDARRELAHSAKGKRG